MVAGRGELREPGALVSRDCKGPQEARFGPRLVTRALREQELSVEAPEHGLGVAVARPVDQPLRAEVQASVDVDRGPGDVPAAVGTEEGDDAGDVVGPPEAAERDRAEEGAVLLR